MRTVKMLAAALLSAVVFADSAPGESDVSARKIRVACVGDSITWGYAMTNR